VYLRDCGDTEIGGFGISARDDPLFVEDVQLVKQICTPMTVEFDDQAVADFFDEQVDSGRKPEQFARIWVHTHPGESAMPSRTDEETFVRCFGRSDWAVMFILAEGGESYARLRFNVGPGGSIVIPVAVDFEHPFAGADVDAWAEEYCSNVLDSNPLRMDVLDQRWETVEPGGMPDDFLHAWSDYVAGDDTASKHERFLELDDIPI
jgi:proteasome lid subunit RPN8/RPN11